MERPMEGDMKEEGTGIIQKTVTPTLCVTLNTVMEVKHSDQGSMWNSWKKSSGDRHSWC